MRLHILSVISLLFVFAAASCTDEKMLPGGETGDAETVSPLRFEVNSFTVSDTRSSEPSDTPEPESDSERKIKDFWLFQFKPDGTQLKAPAYYSMPDNGSTLNELTKAAYNYLATGETMTLFVVTNTGSKTWASGAGFETLDKVKEQKLPTPYPIQAGMDENNDGVADDIYIPMAGQLDNVTVTDKNIIQVPVTRMYAKVKVQVGFNKPDMRFYYADITGIPWYCKVSPLTNGNDVATGEPAAVPFPEGTRMISRAFNSNETIVDSDGNKWLVLYMPENIRGEIPGVDKTTKESIPDIPENALKISIRSKYNGEDYYYNVYPGENKTNNFNIRRNRVYRISIDVRNVTDQHNPSSNCYVVKPGEMLSFEPYNRVEKGGGYNISTYLDPDVTSKRIARVGIIWQTKNCIGDNSNGDLVTWEANEANPLNSKLIIKKTGEEGNALVGAYNSSGQIIWSWHIWVTSNEPDNIANAIIYTTYRWDKYGIYYNERIPGYGIMPCNIGALAFRSSGTDMSEYSIVAKGRYPDSQIRTFGMLYQWGRKDPFPPMIYSTGTEDSNGTLEYEDKYTGDHYANDNRTIVHKTSNYDETSKLFYSTIGRNHSNILSYAIAHPTVYISGTNSTSQETTYANGDWCGRMDSNGLWGGTKGSGGYVVYSKVSLWNRVYVHLYDNYGEKSIFDPCPKGWRVPPGDLWLGFTKDGLNPTDYKEQVNYCEEETGKRPGMSMYVQAWRSGPTIYFPLQGTRIYNGRCMNVGLCGNYHNATCDDNDRVNILHLHRNMKTVSKHPDLMLFKLFEFEKEQYYIKSTAGPIRCVRDSR